MTKRCALIRPGRLSYEDGLHLQNQVWDRVAAGEWAGALILLEHEAVVTLGRNHNAEELLLSPAGYATQGIDLMQCNRGGKATCHNPGQLVGYPILNLAHWQQDCHWYMRFIEEVVINTVQSFGLAADRKEGYTGVWNGDKKIAAIGVAVRRWITSHGFGLNVNNDLSIFGTVVPCGIREFGVTSLLAEGITNLKLDEVAEVAIHEFQQGLQCTFVNVKS